MFREYFQAYEQHTGHPHPPIRASQIARIMQDIPWVCADNKGSYYSDIVPECYPDLIALHFKTRYQHCDYSINHFFSGKIRELRLHEVEAGYE